MDVARLLVQVEANTMQAEAGLASLHKQVALAAIGFGVLAVAAAAGAAVAIHMAGDFQAGIMTLVTGAGESVKNVGMMSAGIKQLALDTGESTKQLIDGMFMIASAGYHGAEGLNILKAAAEGAKVGNADLGTVADAVTTIMRDYPHVMNGAAGAVNALVATVANGKTHMQELSDSIAMVLPTASAAGVSLYDVMGAMATMTGMGVRAANASTYLRQTILNLIAPGAGAKKMLEEIGLSTKDVADMMKVSMPDTLQMIEEHLVKKFPAGSAAYIEAIKTIAGGSKTMQGLLDLTGVHLKDFVKNTLAIGGASVASGQAVQGWSLIQGDFNLQMSKAREMLEVAFISIGEHLLPVVTALVKYIVANAAPAVKNLTKFWEDHKAIILIAAIAIGGALTAAFVVWAAAAAAAAWNTMVAIAPILAIGAAIALLVVGVIYAYTHWAWFRLAVKDVGIAVGQLKDGFLVIWKVLGDLMGRVGDFLTMLGKLAVGAQNALQHLNPLNAIHIPGLPALAEGTQYAAGGAFVGAERGPELLLTPGIYSAPRGSTVLSAQDTAKAMGGGQGGQTVNIYPQKADLDSDDLARHLRRVALLASTSGGYA